MHRNRRFSRKYQTSCIRRHSVLEKKYLEEVIRRFDMIPSGKEHFRAAAALVVERVLDGGTVWVYDREEALMWDADVRASGLFLTSNLYGSDRHLVSGDILVMAAVEPDTPEDISIAEKVKGEGGKVIVIAASSVTGRPVREKMLRDSADIFLDNHSPEVSGVLRTGGMESPFCPVSGVMNDIIFWGLCAAVIDEFFRRGKTPSVYRGVHLFGGREFNNRAAVRYQEKRY